MFYNEKIKNTSIKDRSEGVPAEKKMRIASMLHPRNRTNEMQYLLLRRGDDGVYGERAEIRSC